MAVLSKLERRILLKLRRDGALPGHAKPVWESSANDWEARKAAGMSLASLHLARRVQNSEAPGILHLDLTPAGVSLADRSIEEDRLLNKLKSVQWVSWLALVMSAISTAISFASLSR